MPRVRPQGGRSAGPEVIAQPWALSIRRCGQRQELISSADADTVGRLDRPTKGTVSSGQDERGA